MDKASTELASAARAGLEPTCPHDPYRLTGELAGQVARGLAGEGAQEQRALRAIPEAARREGAER